MAKKSLNYRLLAFLLFASVFLNGLQAGAAQAFLTEIGKEFQVQLADLGAFAAVQNSSVIISPLLTGYLSDRLGKKPFYGASLGIFILGALLIVFSNSLAMYFAGVFLLGLGLSSFQYLSYAIIADDYPVTYPKKVGPLSAMYSIGALIAPLLASWLISSSVSWRYIYVVICTIAVILFILMLIARFVPQEVLSPEEKAERENSKEVSAKFNVGGIILLCTMVAIYCGVEGGFSYFLKPFVKDVLQGANPELAITLFWVGMIPARFLYPLFNKEARWWILLGSMGLVAVLGFTLPEITSYPLSLVLAFFLGFGCGAIYPLVFEHSVGFSGGKTAFASSLVTMSTGIGSVAVTSAFSKIQAAGGFTWSFYFVSLLMGLNLLLGLLLLYLIKGKKNRGEEKKPEEKKD